ncbi:LCP family protein [Streptomyces sp. TP-A0874]|uniref:LCP family protein n=1 Tax=Streptomyces sp. TP-A0874 TaxID=549819 RepID=UPI000AC2CA7D|nr:LCP family protein [Streptomyces sp. TP-A0874]
MSRTPAVSRSGSAGPQPPAAPRRRFPPLRRITVAAAVCAALASGGSVWAVTEAGGADTLDPFKGLKDRPKAGPGVNLLLVGLDQRRNLSAEEKKRLHVGGAECNCTDVMMLAHISEDRRRVSVVSIPRDSYLPFAPHSDLDGRAETGSDTSSAVTRHSGKINGAYDHGGPALTVATVEQATGLRIDHYLETDFSGFVDTVDRLGGGTVCSPEPLKDDNSGLDLAAGTHRVDGRQALQYVRARHLNPPGDLGRVRRQQRLVSELMSKLSIREALEHPVSAIGTARELLTSVRTDKGLTPARLVALGRSLRHLSAEHTEFATVPIADFDHRDPKWGSSLLWDEDRAAELFDKLRRDRPLTPDERTRPGRPKPAEMEPSSVQVRVAGWRGDTGASRVADGLRENGFTVVDDSRAPEADRSLRDPDAGQTEIVYDPYWERYLSTLTTALPNARVRPVEGHGQVFQVTVRGGSGKVTPVVYDRSSVSGAAVTGKELNCD